VSRAGRKESELHAGMSVLVAKSTYNTYRPGKFNGEHGVPAVHVAL
jgi:hypothetical protein